MTAHDEMGCLLGWPSLGMGFNMEAPHGLKVDMRWHIPLDSDGLFWNSVTSSGWPSAGKKTSLCWHVSMLSAEMVLSKPGIPFSSMFYSIQPWGSRQRKDLLCIHLGNKELEVDNLCLPWPTKWAVSMYVRPISHFFHENITPSLCHEAMWPTKHFSSQPPHQLGVAIWHSFGPWKISRSGKSEIAFDFLVKGSTCGWCLPLHFSTSKAAILSEVQQPSCEHKVQAWKITKCQPWYHPFIELKLVAACLQKSYQVRKLNSYLFNPLLVGFSVTGS